MTGFTYRKITECDYYYHGEPITNARIPNKFLDDVANKYVLDHAFSSRVRKYDVILISFIQCFNRNQHFYSRSNHEKLRIFYLVDAIQNGVTQYTLIESPQHNMLPDEIQLITDPRDYPFRYFANLGYLGVDSCNLILGDIAPLLNESFNPKTRSAFFITDGDTEDSEFIIKFVPNRRDIRKVDDYRIAFPKDTIFSPTDVLKITYASKSFHAKTNRMIFIYSYVIPKNLDLLPKCKHSHDA
jgi:hypothetical protein